MDLNKIARFALMFLIVCLLNVQCKDPGNETVPCNCQSKTGKKQRKDMEAVVVYISGNQPDGNQGPEQYILSIEPDDFDRTSYVAGPNLLVPCSESMSVPTEFRKQGLRVLISYKRKECYGALTSPYMRSSYGNYINLTAIKAKNP